MKPVSRSIFHVFVAVLALALAGLAVAPAASAAGAASSPGSLSGQVNAATGGSLAPSSQLTAFLRAEPAYRTESTAPLYSTDVASDGSYTFTGLAAGTYYLDFRDPTGHYADERLMAPDGPGSIDGAFIVDAGDVTVPDLSVVLGATLTVTFSGPGGAPFKTAGMMTFACYCGGYEGYDYVNLSSPTVTITGLHPTPSTEHPYWIDFEQPAGYREPGTRHFSLDAGSNSLTVEYTELPSILGSINLSGAAGFDDLAVIARAASNGAETMQWVDSTGGAFAFASLPDDDYTVELRSYKNGNWTMLDTLKNPVSGAPRVLLVTDKIVSLQPWNVDLAVPSAPRDLSGAGLTDAVALDWNAPAQRTPAVTDYRVEVSQAGGPWTVYADGVSTATSATVAGLTNGVDYRFRISATNLMGTGAATAAVTVTPGVAVVPPAVVPPAGDPRPAPADVAQTFKAPAKSKLRKGKSVKLAALSTQGQALTWQVAKPKQCKIRDGRVIARKGTGKCKLLVTAQAAPGLAPLTESFVIKLRK